MTRFLFAWLALVMLASTSRAQNDPLEVVSAFYASQAGGSCLTLFPTDSLGIQQVIFIRHGEPNLNKTGWRTRKEAEQFVIDYDNVKVVPFSPSPLCLESVSADTIYHSNLARAKHTAHLIFPSGFTWHEDTRFREFDRKIMGFFNLKLPLKFWTSGSRVLWLLGTNDRDIETKRAGKVRAESNALFLGKKAQMHGQAILVAHGFHNRYLKKFLRKQGWTLVRDGGHEYLAVSVVARVRQE